MITMQWSFYAFGMILKKILFLRKKNKKEKGKSSEKMPGPIFNIWPLKLIIE